MERHGGPLGGVAAFALTAGLACDNGGFGALSWNRALVLLCAAALTLLILGAAERPGRWASALLAALGFLTVWTAASWLWSDSPPLALEEAQRAALYFVAPLIVVLAGRRVPPRWIAAGIVAASALVALWNLVTRVRGVEHPEVAGELARPVGYANALALLCVLGLLLLPMLPRPAAVAAVPLVIVLVLQHSAGAYAALVAGVLVLAWRHARLLVVVAALIAIAVAPFTLRSHERTHYWRVAVTEAQASPALGSGAGTFRDWWLRERTVSLSTDEAHSLYLEMLAELGPLGLAAVLAALTIGTAAALRERNAALAGVVVAYGVGAAVDFQWELAGVTVPALLVAATAATHAAPGQALARRAQLVAALLVLTLAGLLAYAGNARLENARDALAGGDRDAAARLARRALTWAPYSSAAWRVIGDAESSRAAYVRAVDLDPNDWYAWQRIAALSTGEARGGPRPAGGRLNPLVSGS